MTAGALVKRLFNARTNVPWALALLTGAGIGGSNDMMVRGLLLGLALGLTWAVLFGKQPADADRSGEV
ncbi:MAG: hypothetical protein RKE49_10370 [Oceanicaulis sp.]